MPPESRQIALLFTALDHRTIVRSSIRFAFRNRYSRQRAAASDKQSSVARTIARIQAESCQRPGHRSSSVSMQIQKRAFPISMTRRTEQSREREKERRQPSSAFHESQPRFPVCTQRRASKHANMRRCWSSGEMDPARYASNTAINFIAGMH